MAHQTAKAPSGVPASQRLNEIQALLFDLDGVTFQFDANARWRQFTTVCDLPVTEIRRRLLDSGFSETCQRGRLRGERALKECARLLGIRLSMERFRDIWTCALTPDPEVLALVREAKQQATVALLTNNSDIVREDLERRYPAELSLFGPRLYSADIGVMKPDPRSFACALDLLELPAQACLLIDAAPQHTATAASLGFSVHNYHTADGLRKTLIASGLLK